MSTTYIIYLCLYIVIYFNYIFLLLDIYTINEEMFEDTIVTAIAKGVSLLLLFY